MTKLQNKPQAIEVWLDALDLPSADRDYQPGHERVQHLLTMIAQEVEVLHQPKLRIRVAGTNGKGSTCQFLATAFQANGFRVGTYTSPHVLNFNERICVNDDAIDDTSLLLLLEKVVPLALETQASYFETATALALLYFSQQQVDIEILEAGVGARFDATTAVSADIGLLTPVALDHQNWLGNTLTAITQEKVFVFQGCTLALSAQQDNQVNQVLQAEARNIIQSEKFTYPLAMLGEHQQQNAGLAWATLQAVQSAPYSVSAQLDLKKSCQAMQDKQIIGRLQPIQFARHQFWLDAAHNEHAVDALLPTLAAMQPFDLILLSTREDRDLSMCAESLAAFTTNLVLMTGQEDYKYSHVAQALSAEVLPLKAGRILVLGSFITLAETLDWMKNHAV